MHSGVEKVLLGEQVMNNVIMFNFFSLIVLVVLTVFVVLFSWFLFYILWIVIESNLNKRKANKRRKKFRIVSGDKKDII